MRIKHRENKIFSSITYYLILIVALAHLIGYIDLMRWYNFTGIGSEARRVETEFGQVGLILMNASALALFVIIAILYNNKDHNKLIKFASVGIVLVFLIRGLFGYIIAILGIVGSTSCIWSLTFSSIALIISILGYFGLKEDF